MSFAKVSRVEDRQTDRQTDLSIEATCRQIRIQRQTAGHIFPLHDFHYLFRTYNQSFLQGSFVTAQPQPQPQHN